MKEVHGITMLIATTLLLGNSHEVVAATAAPPAGIKNVVLVHGAFADGSGWEGVADILTKDGYTVAVVQRPENSYAEDVKFAKAVIDRQSGPAVLVGHSYGGAVITEAGNDPNVSALVYIAAFAPDTAESCTTIEKALPPATQGIASQVLISADSFTSPINLPPGSRSPLGTWWPPETGRSIRTGSA